MDRDSPKTAGVLTSKPNGATTNGNGRGGRNSAQPFGHRRPSKKSTNKPESKENITSDTDTSTSPSSRHPLYSSPKYIRNSSSFSVSTQKHLESPRETRIPRPTNIAPAPAPASLNQQNRLAHLQTQSLDMRQPMSMKSAFALAQKQEADDDTDDTFSIKQAFNMASAEMNGRIDGSPSPAPRQLRRQSYGAVPPGPLASRPNGDLGSRLQQFDRNHKLGAGNGPLNGLFGKTRVGPKVSETGNVLAKKASDSSLRGSPARRRDSQWDVSPTKKDGAVATDLAVGPVDLKRNGKHVPIPSIEYESPSDERASPNDQLAQPSPEKSQNWQLDADFTAGDIQISDSPRIRATQSNGRALRRPSSVTNSPVGGTPGLRRSNNRLDQIRQKEIEAANAVVPEEASSLSRRRNSRIEEVRAREMEALSKRAVATSRLDEIRVRNSEARSESPEAGRSSNREDLRGSSLELVHENTKTPDHKAGSERKGEHVSDTPVTIFRNTSDPKLSDTPKGEGNDPKTEDKKATQLPRNDSHDLLRRLARATSASPPVDKIEQQVVADDPPSKGGSESREDSRSRLTREDNRTSKNLEIKSSRERPTVGFAGLRSRLSSDSIREKRVSQHGSEVDPTDRIEAELKLFAPLDNYSEKGSVRAPSPLPSEPEEDTPRPNRVDPLTQPTPRVTGAYVETPATVKVKQEYSSDEQKALDNLSQISTVPELRSRSSSEPLNKEDAAQEESKDAKRPKTSTSRSSSAPTPSRRLRSALRRRRPLRPLINTAKPPSVKEDIRAILRMNQIDDSTLDEFDSIIEGQEIDDDDLEQMVNDTIHKIDDDFKPSGLSERDRELQVYDRMSKSLRTGLLGIRSAKKGIERLEDKVMHTEHKVDQAHIDPNGSSVKSEIHIPLQSIDGASTIIAIPALYQKYPKFRLTKFGLFALIASIWYIIESIFCFLYVVEYNCAPAPRCDWSPNEPYFPYAVPFMLDEWSTGGKGRELTWRIGEGIGDVLAEISDWVTNTDFTQFDEMYMNVWQRRRHRRRLAKHGLVPKWVPPPGYKRLYAPEEDGYDDEDETMSADERVS
ncbi:hypothetical protein Hte_005183 [Hypoxylon texense]